MMVGIQGTKSFSDYNVFLRAMGTALSLMPQGDSEFLVFSAGPHNVNTMGLEFVNVSERSFRARGLKTNFVKVPPSWLVQNIRDINYLAYFSKPKEPVSNVVHIAEAKDIEVGVYRY